MPPSLVVKLASVFSDYYLYLLGSHNSSLKDESTHLLCRKALGNVDRAHAKPYRFSQDPSGRILLGDNILSGSSLQ